MKNIISDRKIRVGVLGAFRGKAFAETAADTGMELACICDNFKHRLDEVCAELNVPGYEDYDEFLKQDFDAVVVAGPFHQHAMFSKKALLAGKHVLSETSCNATLADGIELYRIARESDLCYMLAENYCYTRFNQEMKRLYDAGEIGEIRYAEGEYNHPLSIEEEMWYAPGILHWRNNLPGCYYNTHALAPMMYITGTMPVSVCCQTLNQPKDAHFTTSEHAYVMLVKMDNGSVFRIYGGGVAGHSCWYGFHGTVGAMESGRGHGYFGPETVRVWHEPWDLKEGQVTEKVYFPNWPSHQEQADKTGHGGGDFFVELAFAEAISTGVQPYLDAYRGIMMTNVGILAWRSAHEGGRWYQIPDIRDPKVQEELLKDRLTPMPETPDGVMMPEAYLCQTKFTPDLVKICYEQWAKQGYTKEQIDKLLKGEDPYK